MLIFPWHAGVRSDILEPVHRELKKKQAPLGRVVVYLDASFTNGDELFHDMQPDPAPRKIVVPYLTLVKTLEDPFFILIFYAYTGINDPYLQAFGIVLVLRVQKLDHHVYRTIFLGKLQGVGDKIHHDLPHLIFIEYRSQLIHR